MSEFLLYAMHEDPIAVGLAIFLVIVAVLGPLMFLIMGPTKRNHERRHQFHSELMCDYCTVRGSAAPSSEKMNRWPMRILGEAPPRGTG